MGRFILRLQQIERMPLIAPLVLVSLLNGTKAYFRGVFSSRGGVSKGTEGQMPA
ncbi:hypothetical protein ATPR_0391 [Acetobacter tropicalis NBRC 101654]|uniref:Uncharacterized protein n=1 Tax=Acetobacter tropicalis NBRC 101654 TaxID=749388 RepID=F7VAJ3_9PROT|nr:hypothetical protein ATPR_0391 [Acetobacter tropicalis NBRC 101654]